MAWRLEHDVLIHDALRVNLQRIAASHWRADARLRSWGPAPLHADGETVSVPCAEGTVLWLGAWMEDAPTVARIVLDDPVDGSSGELSTDNGYQLCALVDASGQRQPIGLRGESLQRRLRLQVYREHGHGRTLAALDLVLLQPAAWERLSGREAPGPLREPPLPPRLG
ncbi:hypothetical protein DFR29_109153 [Tahibacter aquaticus]|uniref:Uncharacterized protein n=1 Tax=Tahibacter aquaticus TaxID=520092 RepID=A0A4R6YUS6_9GAMM|nr:hypothetical protein DFR29_109153 [Tahibacter aquaticus]